MNEKIRDIRQEKMLREVVNQLAAEEIRDALNDETLDAEYGRTLPDTAAYIARIAGRKRRRGLKAVAVMAAVLMVFSGACLASEEVREGLFRFVEKQWGRYHEVEMVYEGPQDVTFVPTVAEDDPRLANVWDAWQLHYYPLYLPEGYAEGVRRFTWQQADEMSDEDIACAQQQAAEDYSAVRFYSADPAERDYITFGEKGGDWEIVYESETNEVITKIVDGREVRIVRAGSSYRCHWQQDDHILYVAGNGISLEEMEQIIANVERIR